MKRDSDMIFELKIMNELKRASFAPQFRSHLVAVLQPTVMFLLMSVILVTPTFDVYMTQPTTLEGQALAAAMDEVGSPIGMPYVKTHFVENIEPAAGQRQVIHVEARDGKNTAVQRFGLIDSNMVKNFRNRLTAAALSLVE